MRRKGFTLVEVIVAMGIFLIVLTLAISAFISVSNLKALTQTMKEVQQKTRITTEMITRLSRQADKVVIDSAEKGKTAELYFNIHNDSPNYGYQFKIQKNSIGDGGTLVMSECFPTEGSTFCDTGWKNPNNLLGDLVQLRFDNSYFRKTGTIPPTLEVKIEGIITNINNNPYYSNELTIDTSVALEGIK